MSTARARRTSFLALLLGAALALLPSLALARQPLQAGIAAKNALTPQEKAAIVKFMDEQKARLSGKPDEIMSGRDQIIAPLTERVVSVEFRQVVAGALVDDLKRLIADQRDLVAVNALRIAGELATSTSVSAAIEGLKDARKPVQYAACFAIARAFDAARTGPAINPNDMNRAVSSAAAFLTAQSDPYLADGAALALTAACRIEGVAGFRDTVMSALAKAASARAATIGDEGVDSASMLAVITRCAVTLRDATLADRTRSLQAGTRTEVATLAAHVLAAIERAVKAGVKPAELASAAQLAETLLLLIAEKPALGLAQPLNAGNGADFSKLLDAKVFGADGVLKALGIDPKQFKRGG